MGLRGWTESASVAKWGERRGMKEEREKKKKNKHAHTHTHKEFSYPLRLRVLGRRVK